MHEAKTYRLLIIPSSYNATTPLLAPYHKLSLNPQTHNVTPSGLPIPLHQHSQSKHRISGALSWHKPILLLTNRHLSSQPKQWGPETFGDLWKAEGWGREHGVYKMDITGTFRKESRKFEGGGFGKTHGHDGWSISQ